MVKRIVKSYLVVYGEHAELVKLEGRYKEFMTRRREEMKNDPELFLFSDAAASIWAMKLQRGASFRDFKKGKATSSFLDALGIITRGDHWDELFLNMTAPAIVLLRVQYEEGLSLSIPGGTIEPDEAPFEACWREVQEETGGLRRAGSNEAARPGFLTKEMFGSHIKCFRLDMGDGGTKHYYVMKHSPHGEEGLDTLVAGTVIVDLPSHYRAGKVCMLDLRGKCKKGMGCQFIHVTLSEDHYAGMYPLNCPVGKRCVRKQRCPFSFHP